jgi:tetratricopeptide (TPR) repeat protein
MSSDAQLSWEDLARRYDLPNQPEWQRLLTLFDVSEGFSLIVLLVLEADGAALCRGELERHLQREGKQLVPIELPTPDDLRQLKDILLTTRPPPSTGCLWMSAVEPDYGKSYPEWREAWREALARLNSHRNPIRRQFNLSLVFVGAPWLQEVMRETAPDLWSVRTLVVRIEPAPRPTAERQVPEAGRSEFAEEPSGGDPLFALREAEKLRGLPGKDLALARLLHRAGEGFAGRDDWRSAEKAFTEALELKQRAGAPATSVLSTLLELAWVCQGVGRARESMNHAQEALRIAREISNRRGEGAALGNLGLAYADLGDVRKAIEFYERALIIAREIDDRRGEGAALGSLGNAYTDLGDARKAIEFYEQALAIDREIGDRHGEGTALGNLGIAYKNLGDARKAIEFFERALVIAREIGNRRGEGNALGNLGLAYTALGDARKTIELFEQALVIYREIGDRRGEGTALWNSAGEFWKRGDRAQAIARAEAALRLYEAIGDPWAAKVRAQLAEWRKAGAGS